MIDSSSGQTERFWRKETKNNVKNNYLGKQFIGPLSGGWINKLVYPYCGILFSLKQEWNDTYINMDESQNTMLIGRNHKQQII